MQAFILVVLCLLFNENFTKASDKDFFFLEHYAGEAVMSQEIQAAHGRDTAKLDIKYHHSMDICTPPGIHFVARATVQQLGIDMQGDEHEMTILVSLLCVALGANWMIEQPGVRFPFLDDALGAFLPETDSGLEQTYTPAFSREMAKLLPLVMKSPPLRPTAMLDASTVEKLRCLDMGEDDWADAGLWDLVRYVYGAKGLRIPEQWKELESAISIATADVKTEPGTESQLAKMQLAPELLQKFSLLQAAMLMQQTELQKLRDRESQNQDGQNAQPRQEPTQEAVEKQQQKESPSAAVVRMDQSPRGSKRSHPMTPVKNPKPPSAPSQAPDEDSEIPRVLKSEALDKLEKEKLRRVVSPKKGSGTLEVPEDIFEMWKDAAKGRQTLFRMWAKSGGVKGGFYSKEDMKSELGYSTSRIEKIVAWAEKNNLVRTCEYDDETLEYWVNTRTLGTMTKEDLEMMQRERKYEGEGGDDLLFKPEVHLDGFDFSDDDRMIHKGTKNLEGDHHKSASRMLSMETRCLMQTWGVCCNIVASQMKEYLKQVLKSKNSLENFVDKIKDFDTLYEEMSEARAEGSYVPAGISEQVHLIAVKYGKGTEICRSISRINKRFDESMACIDPVTKMDIFPWTDSEDDMTVQNHSDNDMDVSGASWASASTREPPSPNSPDSSFHLDERIIAETSLASKVLLHCLRVVDAVRTENGGASLCVFKIGLTSNPVQRRASYLQQNFQNFVVIHKVWRPELLGMLEMLEAALIAQFHDNGFPPPYYAYCVAAKDLVIDAQAAVKRDPCEVLAKIAKVPPSNADAPLFEILRKNGLTLPIDFSWSKAGKVFRYPFLSPRAQLEALSDAGYFHRVLGLPVHLASEGLDLFWNKFRVLHPRHSLFENANNIDFQRLIPYYLHGDGGRGFKKEAIEILSMFPALGTGSRKHSVDLSSKRPVENEIELGINLQGSSGATRFLFTVLSSLVAKTDNTIFDDILELWSQQLQRLLDDGFQVGGSTWRIAILGFTGDSPFVKKVAKTTRSFHNVRKRHTAKKKQTGCCWLCHAGYDDPEQGIFYPFEHLGFSEPLWLQTCKLNNPLPWEGSGSPLVRRMPLDKDDTPAAFYTADFFHVWHAGVGLDFCSSAMVYCFRLFEMSSVEKNISELNASLQVFLKKSKQKLACGRVTEDLLGYSSTREYPEGKWSKNMDTAVFTKFVIWLVERPEFAAKLAADDILKMILATAKAIGVVISTALRAEYYMASADCQEVIRNGHAVLTGYGQLVVTCYSGRLCLFKLRPKVHYLNHIFLRVWEEWRAAGFAVNPLAEATFMSEDFVGRTARLSRRVSTRAVAIKTLQRYLLFMQTALSKDSFAMLDLSMLD
ncbi:unnamed protein product [Symbiodinium sp. CCMP2592]|nr:unnamed protein product [Symbiodinium sp. CCMP2592]